MCTLNCPYHVFTIHDSTGIHSVIPICTYSDIFVQLFIIYYCRLFIMLYIILILEMYSRYFDPVNQ
jgi:hypothetical protein